MISFAGSAVLALLAVLVRPRSLRWGDTLTQMEKTGVDALPIVGLISFLLGLVTLGAATAYLRALTAAGLSAPEAVRQIELEVAADVDIFATVAKIRALRFTWATVLQHVGVEDELLESYRQPALHPARGVQHEVDAAQAEAGREIFQGKEGGCYYCHTESGKGLASQGAANLTDSIWTIANVPGQSEVEGKKAVVKSLIANGVQRHMPHWKDRLTDTDIRLLTVYVHELGGGK